MTLNFNVQPYHDDFNEDKNFHKILFKNKCLHNSPQGVPWRAPAGINASIAEDPQCRARFPRRGLRRKTRTTRLRLNLQIQHHALVLVFKIVAVIHEQPLEVLERFDDVDFFARHQ
mgnify:CR=1 FL=1